MTVKEKIKQIVDEYAVAGDKDLLKNELEILVVMAEKNQMIEDLEATTKIINKTTK